MMKTQEILTDISNIANEFDLRKSSITSHEDWERARVEFVGKKGKITSLFKELRELSPDDKKQVGAKINSLRTEVESYLKECQEQFSGDKRKGRDFFDYTLPGRSLTQGKKHPIRQTIQEICQIFKELGFQIVDGREIETERYNFTVLNIPLDHPARDDFDTFYTEDGTLLRSQTSTAQGRIMEKVKPPIAVVTPGKVYRPDTVDAHHSFMFHQMEGFWVDEGICFSDLKGIIHLFARRFFGEGVKISYRPSFFPFTEPSAEVDVFFRGQWMEILGAGSIHPRVFEEVGYNPKVYQGFAFGLGIERICMMKYNIHDIRFFYENNLKFLNQF